ncbi:MAG: glucosaminidase domain-containing protein [Candidatus Nanoarchaeia archaeon]
MNRRQFIQKLGGAGLIVKTPSIIYAQEVETPQLTTTSLLDKYIPINYESAEHFLKKHGHFQRLEDLLPIFEKTGKDFNLDVRALVGLFCQETGYGQSGEWKERHNGFGIGSFDHNPDNAFRFKSARDGIYNGGKWISENYIHGGRNTKTLQEMHAVPYATDPKWADNIAWIGRRFS